MVVHAEAPNKPLPPTPSDQSPNGNNDSTLIGKKSNQPQQPLKSEIPARNQEKRRSRDFDRQLPQRHSGIQKVASVPIQADMAAGGDLLSSSGSSSETSPQMVRGAPGEHSAPALMGGSAERRTSLQRATVLPDLLPQHTPPQPRGGETAHEVTVCFSTFFLSVISFSLFRLPTGCLELFLRKYLCCCVKST